jgi:hypothetical protein
MRKSTHDKANSHIFVPSRSEPTKKKLTIRLALSIYIVCFKLIKLPNLTVYACLPVASILQMMSPNTVCSLVCVLSSVSVIIDYLSLLLLQSRRVAPNMRPTDLLRTALLQRFRTHIKELPYYCQPTI